MSRSELPEVISIDDITNGTIDADAIYTEMDRLKAEVGLLRHSMSQFLKALATVPEGTNQQEYYRAVSEKLKSIQLNIKEYCAQYNRLVPIINYAQAKLDHDVDADDTRAKPKGKKK